MSVYETDVPGVGKKFELDVGGGDRVVVLIHHDGKREVYHREGDADSEKLFDLGGDEARKLGSILTGAYFQPVEVDEVEVPLGEAIIEWVEVPEGSPLGGTSLRDYRLREATGASVIAVQRGEETLPNPSPDLEVAVGDILVSLGTREEQRALEERIAGDG